MGNTPQKRWTLEELEEKVRPALERPELVEIAATSRSPNAAANEAEKQGFAKELIQACRWLAILQRDYSENLSIIRNTEGFFMETQRLNVTIVGENPNFIELSLELNQRITGKRLKTEIEKLRRLLRKISTCGGSEFEIHIHRVPVIKIEFELGYDIKTHTTHGAHDLSFVIEKEDRCGRVTIEDYQGKKSVAETLGIYVLTNEPTPSRNPNGPKFSVNLFSPQDRPPNYKQVGAGYCWVSPGPPTKIQVGLTAWNDPKIHADEFLEFVELARKKVQEVIETVLNSKR